jgi:hypothetical protein
MVRSRLLAIAALGLALLLAVPEAGAAGRGAHSKAQARFNAGARAYRQGEFEVALSEFKASLEFETRPGTILNVAQCLRQLKNREKALFFYKLYLSEWERLKPGQRSPHKDEVERHIRALSAEMEKKADEGKAPRATVPARREVTPAAPPAPAPPPAAVEAKTASAQVAGGGAAAKPGRRWPVFTIVAGALALAAGGAGLGLGLASNSAFDDLKANTLPDQHVPLKDKVRSLDLGANICIAAAGALAVGAVVLYLAVDRPARSRETGPRVGIGPGAIALSLEY